MSPYTITLYTGGPYADDETYSTIDTAIAEAHAMHGRLKLKVYVVEQRPDGRRVRGVVEEGLYRWVDACPKCAGTGVLQQRPPGRPALVLSAECTRCRGVTFVKEDPR